MTTRIGITLGDVTGIGPEITLKSLSSQESLSPLLILGDMGILQEWNQRLGLNLRLVKEQDADGDERLLVCEPHQGSLSPDLPAGAPQAARAAVQWLEEGARRCLAGKLAGLVTAPVNKESIIRAGQPFVGQTEFLSQLAGTSRTAMMLLGDDGQGHVLRVVLATTHLPIRKVADHITTPGVLQSIQLAARSCAQLELDRARVAVCGLNPHAGEGGLLGTEEDTVIRPAVQQARDSGIDVDGPLAADALFYQAYHGNYDVVVAMYHDQGLAPLKMIGFDRGVNWTLGLPFIRTSPDHGTAYDLAGRGEARSSSMESALALAMKLSRVTPE